MQPFFDKYKPVKGNYKIIFNIIKGNGYTGVLSLFTQNTRR
jgi:hypothetical protein